MSNEKKREIMLGKKRKRRRYRMREEMREMD